uniref:Late endosomal/lysosomal adaptor and MAPK and MTOR activator 5 n=1 Tax=Parastrongyloides trichosuri TaxID=131310 RepID=A0A0N4Z7L0_PARTI
MNHIMDVETNEIFTNNDDIQGMILADKHGYPIVSQGTCTPHAAGGISEIYRMAGELENSKIKHVKLENPISNFVITSNDSLTLGIHQKKM